jgi:DNA-binding transcriptional ArsR family regulator
MIRKVYLRLWNEDRYFILARSASHHRRIEQLLLRAEPPYRRIFTHLKDAAVLPETNLAAAVGAAWNHLSRRTYPGEKAEIHLALARDPSYARLRLHSMALKYGDPTLLASRLFMSPSQVNKTWIEGKQGWALYCAYGRKITKRPLWFIAYQLAALAGRGGDAQRFSAVLRLLQRRPYSYFDLTRQLGQHWHSASRELARRLLVYPLQGKYYTNARMVPLFLEIYDRARARGIRIETRRWEEGKCVIRYSDGRRYRIGQTDLVGGLYDLAGSLGGRDAYGLRGILRYLKGNREFSLDRLRLESGRRDVSYPLQKLRDQGLVIARKSGGYRVVVPLETSVRFYETLLRPTRPAASRRASLTAPAN